MRIHRPLAALLLSASALLAAPAQAGLLAFLNFDTSVADQSGNGVAVSSESGATLDISGGVLTLNGIDESLNVALNVNPSALPRMTWGAWVNPASITGFNQQFLSHDDGGFDRTLGFDRRASVAGAPSAFTGNWVINDTQAATLNAWIFVAGVYDQTANSLSLWVDDREIQSSTTGFGDGLSSFAVGRNPGFGEHFAGSLDNVFVFDSALTGAQIAEIRRDGASAIQALTSPVPEPGSTPLMLSGLLLLGWVMRRHGTRA